MPCCDLNRSREEEEEEEEEGLGWMEQQKRAKLLFQQNLEGVVEAEAVEHHQLRLEVVAVEAAEEEEEEEEEVVVVVKKLEIWLNARHLGLRVDI